MAWQITMGNVFYFNKFFSLLLCHVQFTWRKGTHVNIAITWQPSSICQPSHVINFSHLNILLWNHSAKYMGTFFFLVISTWLKMRFLLKPYFMVLIFICYLLYPPQTKFGGGGYIGITLSVCQSVCPSMYLVSATPPKPLNGFLWNFIHL
jgi:hypothetical protein